MAKIKKIIAREMLDSQGDSALEVKVFVDGEIPSKVSLSRDFASLGAEREDFGEDIKNIEKIVKKELIGLDVTKQQLIDERLTLKGGNLSNEASMALSLGCARSASQKSGKDLYLYLSKVFKIEPKKHCLPTPVIGLLNGGKHADTNLDFEEFSIIPLFEGSFSEKLKAAAAVFKELGRVLRESGFDSDSGAEGGYAPDMRSSIQALELIVAAVIRSGYQAGPEMSLGIDIGSSQIYNKTNKRYIFRLDKVGFSNNTLVGLYHEWLRMFPIFMIEDGLGEDDWGGWKELTKELGRDVVLVGDDFFSSDFAKLRKGASERVANTVSIKLGRFRTLCQLANFASVARTNGYSLLVSHSYGETGDDSIADLSVALGAEYFKSGSLSRWERVAKYNRLAEIEYYMLNKKNI